MLGLNKVKFFYTKGYREVVNLLSAYIDGSAIYGMNSNISQELRTFSNGIFFCLTI